jgi:hypothetical protein
MAGIIEVVLNLFFVFFWGKLIQILLGVLEVFMDLGLGPGF